MNTPDTEGVCTECRDNKALRKGTVHLIDAPNCYLYKPDTEWEKIVGKFWESEVPVEDEYGGDKAGWLKNSPIAKFMLKTLSYRDTYWKERELEAYESGMRAGRNDIFKMNGVQELTNKDNLK